MNNRKFTEVNPYIFSTFCFDRKFEVPPFQRSYTWKQKQINDLWESIIHGDNEYFIGNIVCLEASENSDDRIIIIDGQQRFFTIFLFLTVLRDEYRLIKTSNKDNRKRIKQSQENIDNILFYKEKKYPFKSSLRLIPRKENLKDIYERIINSTLNVDDKNEVSKLDDNQLRYVKNYQIMRRLIRKHIKEENVFKELDQLQEKLTSLLFITIICKSDNDAYKIFEGLNATGIGLSVADLVKNAILKATKREDSKGIVEENWENIEALFEKTKISLFPKFLRHQWISREGYITTNKLFDAIKENKLKGKESSEIIKYTKEILNDAKIYIGLRFEEMEGYLGKTDKNLLDTIRAFRYLDVDQVYEVLLAYYNKFINTEYYTPKQFISDLFKLWIFSLRARIISINPSEYEKTFADYCKHIYSYKSKKTNEMSLEFYKETSKLVNNNEAFIENLVTEMKYSNDNRLIRYLLELIIKRDNPGILVDKPTIEHIVPRDPIQWKLKLDEIKSFVNSIGNLTLLYEKDNKKLSNSTMKEKVKKVFSKSPFKINHDLVKKMKEFETDPKKAIEKRSYKLAEAINEICQIKI